MKDVGRGRSLRIAFLVTDSGRAQEMLDEIFAFCQGLYGGRFALIVPCANGQISAAYWQFLQALDPDIVYSYVPLSAELQHDIHERLYPSEIMEHDGVREHDEDHGLRPELAFPPLGSLSLLPLAARPEQFARAGPVSLVDLWSPAPTDRFLLDNFGFRSESEGGWSRHHPEDVLARPLYYYPSELPRDPRSGPGEGEDVFTSAASLLELMRRRRVLTMSSLAAMETRRLDYHESEWRHRFVVVVGDSFADRIAFWNIKHLQPAWLDRRLTVLRTTATALAGEHLAREVGGLIALNNGFGHNNGPAEVRLLSFATSGEDLAALREQLRAHCRSSTFTHEQLTSLDRIAPGTHSRRHAYELEGGRLPIGAGTPWETLRRTGREITVSPCPPAHCEMIGADYSHLRRGWWPIDCSIERTDDLSPYSNVQDTWQLPRRLRLLGALCKAQHVSLEYSHALLTPRVSRGGLLTVWGSFRSAPFVVDEPSDEAALRFGLLRGRDWWLHPHDREHPQPPQIAQWARSSDKARYLTGVLHLFGGLHQASGVLLHEFWLRQFERLGANAAPDPVTVHRVANRLRKRYRGVQSVNPQEPEVLTRLADDALRAARAQRRSPPYIDFENLRQEYDGFAAAFERDHPRQQAVDEEYVQRERESVVRSTQSLCRRQVLHQGYEWLCERCMARNWAAIERLARELECMVCGTKALPPVDRPWGFRLNEFVLHALRDQGTLPLLWTLSELQRSVVNGAMFFLGPTELFFGDARDTADAEIDLLISLAGKLILCEVKSSDRAVDLEKLAHLASRIRPDVTLLSVAGLAKPRLAERTAQLRRLLESVPTEPRIVSLNRDSLDRNPWLPELD